MTQILALTRNVWLTSLPCRSFLSLSLLLLALPAGLPLCCLAPMAVFYSLPAPCLPIAQTICCTNHMCSQTPTQTYAQARAHTHTHTSTQAMSIAGEKAEAKARALGVATATATGDALCGPAVLLRSGIAAPPAADQCAAGMRAREAGTGALEHTSRGLARPLVGALKAVSLSVSVDKFLAQTLANQAASNDSTKSKQRLRLPARYC